MLDMVNTMTMPTVFDDSDVIILSYYYVLGSN